MSSLKSNYDLKALKYTELYLIKNEDMEELFIIDEMFKEEMFRYAVSNLLKTHPENLGIVGNYEIHEIQETVRENTDLDEIRKGLEIDL